MTKGISKDYLEDKLLQAKKYNDITIIDILKYLITQCVELDPWLEIDDKAKESKNPLLVKNGDDIDLCIWREDLRIWYPSYFEPTHYKEVKL